MSIKIKNGMRNLSMKVHTTAITVPNWYGIHETPNGCYCWNLVFCVNVLGEKSLTNTEQSVWDMMLSGI